MDEFIFARNAYFEIQKRHGQSSCHAVWNTLILIGTNPEFQMVPILAFSVHSSECRT